MARVLVPRRVRREVSRIVRRGARPKPRALHVIRVAEEGGASVTLELPSGARAELLKEGGVVAQVPLRLLVKGNEAYVMTGRRKVPLKEFPKEFIEEIMTWIKALKKMQEANLEHVDVILKYV